MDYNKKTKNDLVSLCKERKIKGYSTLNKTQIIEKLEAYDLNPSAILSTSSRTKANARTNESTDLKFITDALHNNTDAGRQLKTAFFEKFGKEIQDARQIEKAGNNNSHYDLQILVENIWCNVEHKGSADYKPIDTKLPPWSQGVQFYNGICDKYTLGRRYAREWYDKYIISGHLSQKYNLKANIPTFEEWFNGDAKVCGDPKTPFGIELRSQFRGDETKSGGCFDERDELRRTFIISDDDIKIINDEVLRLAQSVLSEKKYWLQIQGNLQEKFYCAWHPELKLTTITKVEKDMTCSDLQFKFCSDMGFEIKARLRWGKGQGLSNIRIDLR